MNFAAAKAALTGAAAAGSNPIAARRSPGVPVSLHYRSLNNWNRTRFGWAGSLEPGRPHYYRIQGSGFLIEYDNVQNGANHIHTVGRDFDGDFGRDLLREHHRAEPH